VDPRRAIPSVDRLLASEAFAPLLATLPRDVVVAALQEETQRVRTTASALGATADQLSDPAWYASRVQRAAQSLAGGSLHTVINATGVILHTNLGRAPLAQAAVAAIQAAASGYADLEYDLYTGTRGSRYVHCRDLLMHLTGAEDALVVNNNAAALVLALNTFARGRDAVISRGELVEIGGAFRVPEIMERSGAILREVGATNRTHAADYRNALSEHTGAILKVHPSNFVMDGYIAEASVRDLAPLAAGAGVPLIHDVGSGLLFPAEELGLPPEPLPQQSIRDGADIVTMSGDKLLGGPQCGIILGRPDFIQRMRVNPLCRALRVDKLTLAALSATLRLYLDPATARREVPVLRMITLPPSQIAARVTALADRLRSAGVPLRIAPGESAIGGGAAPGAALPTTLLQLDPACGARTAEERLRRGHPPVVARIVDDAVVVDLRTVPPEADDTLFRALAVAATT
jgi:L-seryl-tRNA(Ser) seleniumtransferase